ncbi:unnamed protein product, partial [Effrenium voratum]
MFVRLAYILQIRRMCSTFACMLDSLPVPGMVQTKTKDRRPTEKSWPHEWLFHAMLLQACQCKRKAWMELTPASPRLPPASPALTTFSDPEITDWWCIDNLPADSPFHVAVQEMRRYFADWTAASRDPFWQRKSGKTVLSVLLCHN